MIICRLFGAFVPWCGSELLNSFLSLSGSARQPSPSLRPLATSQSSGCWSGQQLSSWRLPRRRSVLLRQPDGQTVARWGRARVHVIHMWSRVTRETQAADFHSPNETFWSPSETFEGIKSWFFLKSAYLSSFIWFWMDVTTLTHISWILMRFECLFSQLMPPYCCS